MNKPAPRLHTPNAIAADEQFQRDGYRIIRGFTDPSLCAQMQQEVQNQLTPLRGPAEFEADTGYLGAPKSRSAPGGNTTRRLLHAYSRSPLFQQWAVSTSIRTHLMKMIGSTDLQLSQCHHNCIMTKHPGYSSVTNWHQDIRYWQFDRPELVTVWLALSHEYQANGALSIIPGSHKLTLDSKQLDSARFLRTDLARNQPLLLQAKPIELQTGDVLFFHSRLLHAASTNQSTQVKTSLVFTYHASNNHPVPNTRSSQYPSITL